MSALTRGEWAAALRRGDFAYFAETEDVTDHGVAALLLHDQPFGFTWADVDALRLAAAYDPTTGELSMALDSLAQRIEELLPPR